MIPVSSNTFTSGCNPISSNCVVWQGPDISCINICNGDTVSDVVAKLATELCTIMGEVGIADLDLSCFNLSSQNVPSDMTEFLQILIDRICALEDVEPGGGTVTPSTITATLPLCLQYENLQNDLVTVLPIDEYAELVAAKLCQIISQVATHQLTLSDHETRITVLENASVVTPTVLTVTPNCILPSIPTAITTVVDTLEAEFCDIKNALGESTSLLASTTYQCSALNTENALSQSGTMSGLIGWNTTVNNVSESLTNMWLTICDIRAAVRTIQQTCCTTDCSAFIFNVTATLSGTNLVLNYNGTVAPLGWTECNPLGAAVQVTDGLGGSYTVRASMLTALGAGGLSTISLSTSGLNPYVDYIVTVDPCLTNGTIVCEKSKILTVTNPASSCSLPSGVTASIA